MVGLIEDSWILTPASVFNLLHYVVWVAAYEENPASPRYIVERVRSIVLTFQITEDSLP